MKSETNNHTFETCLFNHCAEGKSGTVSIATNNNKSCQIVINNGDIVAVMLGRLKGYEAIIELVKVGFKRASFNKNLQLPITDKTRINSSDKLLKYLGYNPTNTSLIAPEEAIEAIKDLELKMYRGQEVKEIEMEVEIQQDIDNNSQKLSVKKVKSVRMYRGQIVED